MGEALAEGIMYENLKADYAKRVVVFTDVHYCISALQVLQVVKCDLLNKI